MNAAGRTCAFVAERLEGGCIEDPKKVGSPKAPLNQLNLQAEI
jgi:hypothetical protein